MTSRGHGWPSKIRARLTLHYAAAFVLAGAVLVALMLLFLAHALDGQLGAPPDRDHVLTTMLVACLLSLGGVAVVVTGLGWMMAGHALRPLQQITATARRVADRSLHERIGLDGPDDEIKDLADTFDAMLERLDRAFDGQRRFVANASHELRTPLTLNRTLIEVTLDDPDAHETARRLGATLLAVNARHERLIDGLLTLASSEQRLTDATTVDLADVAGNITRQAAHTARDAGVRLETDLAPAPVTGDPILLERLIQNLIDNAVRYNVARDGLVMVSTGVVDGTARLTVDNTGPTIASYEIPALFEPFRRLPGTDRVADPRAGRGAGLGLSIVKAVAESHGGDVRASPRDGGGLTVRVRIRAAPLRAAPPTAG
jgi:signal transduction histidine kinase